MSDGIAIIGWDDDPDTERLKAAFDLNHIRYKYWPDNAQKHPKQKVVTVARVNGINIDFLGWEEDAVKFIVEQYPYPTIIKH